MRGRRSTPGRYFQVAQPGLGWGGTDITDPLAIIERIDPKPAWPGQRLLLTSTTGEDALYCVLDDTLAPVPAAMPDAVRAVVERIGENCEPSLCSVVFVAGAGGSLRAGVTANPVLLTQSVARGETRVTMGGAPVYLWPGGGITVMADVLRMPKLSFGHVPTPAIVAPIEFTLPRALYAAPGRAHAGHRAGAGRAARAGRGPPASRPGTRTIPGPSRRDRSRGWRGTAGGASALTGMDAPTVRRLSDDRLHLSHGPIDVVLRGLGHAPKRCGPPKPPPSPCSRPSCRRSSPNCRRCACPWPGRRTSAHPVARRMVAACAPFAPVFVTPMAAVAGAVADALLAAMRAAPRRCRAPM